MSLTDIMSHANVAVFAEIALLMFAVTFVAIIVHTCRRPRADVSRMAAMALDLDELPRPNRVAELRRAGDSK